MMDGVAPRSSSAAGCPPFAKVTLKELGAKGNDGPGPWLQHLPRVLEHAREVPISPLGAAGRRGPAEPC